MDQLSYGGRDGACARAASGSVYCWQDKPTPTKLDTIGPVADFSAGISGTCAITKTGEVLCWGDHSNASPTAIAFPF